MNDYPDINHHCPDWRAMDLSGLLRQFGIGIDQQDYLFGGLAQFIEAKCREPWMKDLIRAVVRENESAPRTDAARVVYGGEAIEALSDSVSVAFARSLERQLRAAERLLAEYSFGIQSATELCEWLDKIEAHLAAAREEDEG